MSTYLYAYGAKLAEPLLGYVRFDQEVAGKYVYLSTRPLGYPGQLPVGAWNGDDGSVMRDEQGNPIPIDPLFDLLRPIGNIDGVATNSLLHHYFMGHGARQVQANPAASSDPRFPSDNQPMVLTMEHRWDDTAGWEGWGWLATIEFSDPNRAPDARAIGIYTEGGSYLYTTGAFVWTDTGEVDAENQPVYKWQTHNPEGRATAEKEPLYYAMLFGAAQEGKAVLDAGRESHELYFWEVDQVIPGEAWVDIGQTVTNVFSTVVVPEDINLFPVGTAVRINNIEYVVATIWAAQGFTTTPNADHTGSVGEIIWVWQ